MEFSVNKYLTMTVRNVVHRIVSGTNTISASIVAVAFLTAYEDASSEEEVRGVQEDIALATSNSGAPKETT